MSEDCAVITIIHTLQYDRHFSVCCYFGFRLKSPPYCLFTFEYMLS